MPMAVLPAIRLFGRTFLAVHILLPPLLVLLELERGDFSSSGGFSSGGGSGLRFSLPLPLLCCLRFFLSLRATEPPFEASLCAHLVSLFVALDAISEA